MKRIIGLLLCLCTIFSLCFALTSCLRRSAEDREKMVRYDENGVGYLGAARYDENGNVLDRNGRCVVRLPVNLSEDSCEIYLSEQYTEMSRSPDFKCEWKIIGDGYLDTGVTFTENTPVFTVYIHISKQMNCIDLPNRTVFYKKNENGEYIKHILRPYFYCDENNKEYYSDNGILYHKSNKTPLGNQWQDIISDYTNHFLYFFLNIKFL